MRGGKLAFVLAITASVLASCATQQAMTVNPGPIINPIAKYKNAMAVRTVGGGRAMDIITRPGVTNEPFLAVLQGSLALNGYLAQTGTAKYTIDAEIHDLQQPIIGADMDVTATVIYKVSGSETNLTYPITAKGSATFSDSLIGADRLRLANERAMQENIKQFLQALR
jgi:hypothetical protein